MLKARNFGFPTGHSATAAMIDFGAERSRLPVWSKNAEDLGLCNSSRLPSPAEMQISVVWLTVSRGRFASLAHQRRIVGGSAPSPRCRLLQRRGRSMVGRHQNFHV